MRLKNTTLLIFLLLLSILVQARTPSGNSLDNPWKVIEEQSINGISTKLKLKSNPSLKDKNWISIEFENQTGQALLIEDAFYVIDCKVYHKKGGKMLKQGRIASRSATEILDKSIDSPFPMMDLSPGNSSSSAYPSIIGAILLSAPAQNTVYVEASLQLFMKLSGPESFKISWEEIPFNFVWSRPEPIEFSDLYQQLNSLLEQPVYSTLHHYELMSLLSVQEISKGLSAKTLIDGLKKRSSKEDGRHAILYHLNDHFNEEQVVKDYYLELLKAKDAKALEELSKAPDIWDNAFLEPLIEQYQQANLHQMHQVMDVLYAHQKSWIKEAGIPAILSDLILYKFEEFIYETPANLDRRALFTASLLLDMLGKTGNPEVIPILCPFLEEEERILDTGLVLDPNSIELPRPMRVCDNALEAIMRLENKDLIKTYHKAKYRPPYENGEAEIIISRIRDKFIESLQAKGKSCGAY